MVTPETRAGLVRFGPFEMDLRGEELRRDGARIRIQQGPFRLLARLVESPGAVVTREELREQLWPDGIFVDFEHGLNTAVKKIRLALHDSPEHPQFVETVRGRGYRFLAPVTRVDGQCAPARSADADALGRWYKLWLLVAGVAVAVAMAAFGTIHTPRTSGPRLPRVVPLTSYPGEEYQPTFSPDGSHVAFVWSQEGQHDIYVQPVDLPQPRRLTDAPEIEHSPAWSPDGHWIAFIRDPAEPGGNARVLLKPPAGGLERVVTEYAGSRVLTFWQRQLAWTPHAGNLVLSRPDDGRNTWSLFRVEASSGRLTPLTSSPALDLAPAVSPDGRAVAFVRQIGEWSTIHLLPLSPDATAAGPPRTLVGRDMLDELGLLSARMPAWTPDGESVVFGGVPQGSLYLVGVDDAHRVARVPAGPGILDMTFCPRTGRLAYALWRLRSSIQRLDLSPGSDRIPTPAAFNSTQRDDRPVFSPDGATVAFVSHRRGRSEVWLSRPDGSGQRPLVSAEGWQSEPSWSPDGERVAYAYATETGSGAVVDVQIARVVGGAPRWLTRDPAEDREPCWSPDGRWIYFSSRRDGGRRIWRQPAEGGPPERVTAADGSQPALSADGRFLYYARGGTNRMSVWRVATDGGGEERVLDSVHVFTSWHLTGDGIYYFEPPPPDSRPALLFLDLATSRTRRLAVLEGRVAQGLAVSPDRSTVLFTRIDGSNADLTLRDWP